MTMQGNRTLEIQTVEQIKLTQAKYQPPAGQRHREHHPQSDQGDDDSIAFSFPHK